jgi:hypothetical protein
VWDGAFRKFSENQARNVFLHTHPSCSCQVMVFAKKILFFMLLKQSFKIIIAKFLELYILLFIINVINNCNHPKKCIAEF